MATDLFNYDIHLGPGKVCFIQRSPAGNHINVAHCYTDEDVARWFAAPQFHADFARVAGRIDIDLCSASVEQIYEAMRS